MKVGELLGPKLGVVVGDWLAFLLGCIVRRELGREFGSVDGSLLMESVGRELGRLFG